MAKHWWGKYAKAREEGRYKQECFKHLKRYVNDTNISLQDLSIKTKISEEKLEDFLNSKCVTHFAFARVRDFLESNGYFLYTKPCKICGKYFYPSGNQLYCSEDCKSYHKRNMQKR